MEKKYINFSKTMSADKRNKDFAYSIMNINNNVTRGLYPARDFTEYRTLSDSAYHIVNGGYIYELGYSHPLFTTNGTDSKIEFAKYPYTWTDEVIVDVAETREYYHVLMESGKIFGVNKDGNTAFVPKATLSGTDSKGKMLYDGTYLYIFFDNKIYRRLPEATFDDNTSSTDEVFGNTGIFDKDYYIAPFGDQIMWAFQQERTIRVYVWGKDNATLLDMKIQLDRHTLIALGAIGDGVYLVHGRGDYSNRFEFSGHIIVSRYDGGGFVELNRIEAGNYMTHSTAVATSYEEMIISLSDENDFVGRPWGDEDIYNKAILMVFKDGAMQFLYKYGTLEPSWVDFGNDSILIGIGDKEYYNRMFDNTNQGDAELENMTTTKYVTNLLDFTGTKHKFGGIGVTFEKIRNQNASCAIYYRVSDKDDWILIDTITVDKIKENIDLRQSSSAKQSEIDNNETGLNVQVYEITKMPDGTPFNEYYEIQFKFEPKKGFSIIDAWYYTTAQKRVTMA